MAALAAVVAVVLPTVASAEPTTTGVAGALLAVAVAALVHTARGSAVSAVRTSSGPVTGRRTVPVALAARTTDPTHHPRRPRAPGRA